MKSVRFLITFLIFAVSLCFHLNVQAQWEVNDKLPRPVLDAVSIHPTTGEIKISWDIVITPESPQVHHFVIFWYDNTYSSGGFHPLPFEIPITPHAEKTFFYDDLPAMLPMMPDPKSKSVTFAVSAIQVTATGKSRSLLTYEHSNMKVNSKFDSCRSEIRLNWYRYRGWWEKTTPYKPLVSYHVMQSIGGGPYEEIKMLSDQDTSHIVTRVKDNEKYSFYIAAKRSDGMIATSYQTERITTMPRPPEYITAVGTEYNSDGLAEIKFKLDSNAETYSYEFFGSSRHEYSFISLGAFNIHGDTTLTDVQKRDKTHYYKLEAWHICKNKYTATSNLATALFLTVLQEGAAHSLSWTPYLDWGGDARYEIYRNDELIYTVTDPEPTAYIDDLSSMNDCIKEDVCYRIIAKPVTPNLNNGQEEAISNIVCITSESRVWMPKGFIPEAGVPYEELENYPNAMFKPFFCPLPEEFTFHVYDRNGAKVFETNDLEAGRDGQLKNGWDGRLMNGKPASEGIYTYYLKFRTAMGRIIQKSGTFSLLLP